MITVFFDRAAAVSGRAPILHTMTGLHADGEADSRLEVQTYDPRYSLTHHVDLRGANPVLTPNAIMPGKWSKAKKTLSGLPIPCRARILGAVFDVADGEVDLSHYPAADYAIDVWAVGYLNARFQVSR